MEKEIIFFQMEILIMEMKRQMENLLLKMEIFMKENLKIIFFLVKVFLIWIMEIVGNFKNGLINGNGIFKNNNGEMYNCRFFNGKNMVLESFLIKMEIYFILDIGIWISLLEIKLLINWVKFLDYFFFFYCKDVFF